MLNFYPLAQTATMPPDFWDRVAREVARLVHERMGTDSISGAGARLSAQLQRHVVTHSDQWGVDVPDGRCDG